MTQPREKLETQGVRSLTDEELLAVMLGSGGKGRPVRAIARSVLPALDRGGTDVSMDALLDVPGVGRSKAMMLAASLEFYRRRVIPDGVRISSARDVPPLLEHLVNRRQEHVVAISLSGAHEVIRIRTVSIGLLASCPVHPREIFVGAIRDSAYSVIVAHNHPSGDPSPSEEDKRVTQQLHDAAKTLGIRLLDHIIFARRGFFSFQEAGLLS